MSILLKTYKINVSTIKIENCKITYPEDVVVGKDLYGNPQIKELSEMENIEIIGLNYKDNPQNANSFLKELSNPYKFIFLDVDGTLAIEWGAYGVPESFLIYDNKIIRKYIGPLNKVSVEEIKSYIR